MSETNTMTTLSEHLVRWVDRYAKGWKVHMHRSLTRAVITLDIYKSVEVPLMMACSAEDIQDVTLLLKAVFPDITNRTLKKVYSIRPPRYTSTLTEHLKRSTPLDHRVTLEPWS